MGIGFSPASWARGEGTFGDGEPTQQRVGVALVCSKLWLALVQKILRWSSLKVDGVQGDRRPAAQDKVRLAKKGS